jgi:hypothetical protein
MPVRSKLILFLILASAMAGFTSCKKAKNDVIPTVYVDFYISLNDPLFLDLLTPLTFAYVDATTNNMGQSAAGYDGNGIIIFNYNDEQFFAYDRTCPYDYEVNKKSVKINVVDFFLGVCPECGTKYDLTSGGVPHSGVGRYQLKNYRAGFNGLLVHVYNY